LVISNITLKEKVRGGKVHTEIKIEENDKLKDNPLIVEIIVE
jgi:hypothetical protein